MDNVALMQLIPADEMAPGAIGAIRNKLIDAVVELASRELSLAPSKLVVRDIRPVEDLTAAATVGVASTIDDWVFTTAATTVTGYIVYATGNMADQRYMCIFGARDNRMSYGVKQAAATIKAELAQNVSLIRINVGGADKVIWDLAKVQAYPNKMIGVSPGGVIIPQNTVYTISMYKVNGVASTLWEVVLEGFVVEPRGRVVSP